MGAYWAGEPVGVPESSSDDYWKGPNVNRKLIVFLFILISSCQGFYAQVDRAVVRGQNDRCQATAGIWSTSAAVPEIHQ